MKRGWNVHWPALALVGLACSMPLLAQWPDWRGPTADGHTEATRLPRRWSETENIVWKTPIHDLGYSTPVIWGGRVWLTTATKDGRTLYAVCVDAETGKVVHDVAVFHPEKPQRIHPNNSYATPSAVVEEGRVYVHYGTHGTAAVDTQTGAVLWRRSDLNCDHMQGPVSSPVLFDDLIILHFEGIDVQYIVGLDKATGRDVWRYDRPRELYETVKTLAYRKAYHTPVLVEVEGKTQLISNGALLVTGHEPRTGRELWRVRYRDDSTISRIVSGRGLLFVNTGGNPGAAQLWAVRQGGVGDVTDSHVVWKMTDDVPLESSPLLVEDLLYVVSDNGTLTCLEAMTGTAVWQQELPGRFGASLLYGDHRIYVFSKHGVTTVIEPGRRFHELAVNELEGGFWASPAVKDQSLLLRTKTHLYRVEEKP